MDKEQLEVKVAYLVAENNRLRDALLDAQIKAGEIGFKEQEGQA